MVLPSVPSRCQWSEFDNAEVALATSAQDNFDKSEIQPLRAPLDTLLDVDHLMAWAAASDATFHRVRGTAATVVIATGYALACLEQGIWEASSSSSSSSSRRCSNRCSEEGGARWD